MSLPDHPFEHVALNWNAASSRLSPTPGIFARENLPFVQEAGYFETEPGYFTERRELDSLLMVLTVAGSGQLSYRGQSFTIGSDSLMWIDCREHHRYEHSPGADWKFFWVHFTGASSLAYYRQFSEIANGQPVIQLDRSTADAVSDLFSQLICQQLRHGLPADLLTAQLLANLMTRVLLHETDQTGTLQSLHPAVSAAIRLMENHLSGGIGLQELAAEAKVSRYYLIKLFVRQTGLTPLAYWQQMRLSEAKRLLHQTDWTIERIADAVGLVPGSHLIAIFRRVEHITPGQYRKRWLNRGQTSAAKAVLSPSLDQNP
ncbi:MAG: AraC family transcriptional regulator [Clostridia bacterium]|nr:AraC family transcriptional regulator [Clostridia bacterium]